MIVALSLDIKAWLHAAVCKTEIVRAISVSSREAVRTAVLSCSFLTVVSISSALEK